MLFRSLKNDSRLRGNDEQEAVPGIAGRTLHFTCPTRPRSPAYTLAVASKPLSQRERGWGEGPSVQRFWLRRPLIRLRHLLPEGEGTKTTSTTNRNPHDHELPHRT